MQAEAERERQRALAEAVVRNLNTHELVAIASGRVPAGLAANGEQRAGVSEVKTIPVNCVCVCVCVCVRTVYVVLERMVMVCVYNSVLSVSYVCIHVCMYVFMCVCMSGCKV